MHEENAKSEAGDEIEDPNSIFVTFPEGIEAGVRFMLYHSSEEIEKKLSEITPSLSDRHKKDFASQLVATIRAACNLQLEKGGHAMSAYAYRHEMIESDDDAKTAVQIARARDWEAFDRHMAEEALSKEIQDATEAKDFDRLDAINRIRESKKIPKRKAKTFLILAFLISMADENGEWPTSSELIDHMSSKGKQAPKSSVSEALDAIGRPKWIPDARRKF